MIILKEAWKPDIKRDLVHAKFGPLQPALLRCSEMSSWPRPVILSKEFFTLQRGKNRETLFCLITFLRINQSFQGAKNWACDSNLDPTLWDHHVGRACEAGWDFCKIKEQTSGKKPIHMFCEYEDIAQNKLNLQLLAINCCSFR